MYQLLPVTLTLAALAADGADGLSIKSTDPLTRRSTHEKNFIRFGRAFNGWAAVKRRDPGPAVGRRVDSNFIRFGRRDSNFIRFGRGEVYTPGDNRIPRRPHYDVDVDGLEVRFGRSGGSAAAAVPLAAAAYDRR